MKQHAKTYQDQTGITALGQRVAAARGKKLGLWVDLERSELIDDQLRVALHQRYHRSGNKYDKQEWLAEVNQELRDLIPRDELPYGNRIITDVKVTEEHTGGDPVYHGQVLINGEVLSNIAKPARATWHL